MEIKFDGAILGDPTSCRVFITHMNGLQDDYRYDLMRFGRLCLPIFDTRRCIFPDTAPDAEKTYSDRAARMIDKFNFNADTDYLALAGDVLIQAIVVSVISRRVGSLTVLRYDKKGLKHWPFKIK